MTNPAVSIEDAARMLSVHPRTVRRLIERGEIPAGRIGHQWRIDPEVLAAMIRGGRREVAA